MKLRDYWDKLNELINRYDQNFGHIEASGDADTKHYLNSRQRMEGMIKIGLQIEQTTFFDPKRKITLAKELDNLSSSKTSPEDLPSIPGPKSFTFTREVVLPAINTSLQVDHGKLQIWASKKIGLSIEDRTKRSLLMQKIMEARINEYENKHSKIESPHIKQSIFGPGKEKLTSPEDIDKEIKVKSNEMCRSTNIFK
jgi:hypothetical protein